jgi:hypothetical protein
MKAEFQCAGLVQVSLIWDDFKKHDFQSFQTFNLKKKEIKVLKISDFQKIK